tara:strand:+ start:2068 stop:2415 length:348 start_codon:yes stop_codon:yes gene_type:complete
MGVLTLQQITEAGGSVTYSTASGGDGDTADNSGSTFLHIKNGSGETSTIATITAQTTSVENSIYGDLTKANATVTIAAGAEAFIGPFKPAAFNLSGDIVITYSSVDTVTIAALYI